MNLFLLLSLTTIISYALSSCGMYKFVYFFSLGYGFAMIGIGIELLIIFRNSLTVGTIILSSLFILYGVRLSGYLAYREIKSAAYRKVLNESGTDNRPLTLKLLVWTAVVFLYVFMTIPVTFRLYNRSSDDIIVFICAVIAYIGFIIEFLADQQKSNSKKKNPKMFVSDKLYKFVRCPNYFGELIIWTGVFISGFTIYNSLLQWTLAILGYIGINYVMFSGARRLELRQDKSYGDNSKYKEYKSKTPIIIPFIPIYSVKKYKWLIA